MSAESSCGVVEHDAESFSRGVGEHSPVAVGCQVEDTRSGSGRVLGRCGGQQEAVLHLCGKGGKGVGRFVGDGGVAVGLAVVEIERLGAVVLEA